MKIIDVSTSKIESRPIRLRERVSVDIEDLVESVKRIGIVYPVVVFRKKDSRYTLIDGERRVLAAREAGITKIKAIVLPLIKNPLVVANLDIQLNTTYFPVSKDEEDKFYLHIANTYKIKKPEKNKTIKGSVGKDISWVDAVLRSLKKLTLTNPKGSSPKQISLEVAKIKTSSFNHNLRKTVQDVLNRHPTLFKRVKKGLWLPR